MLLLSRVDDRTQNAKKGHTTFCTACYLMLTSSFCRHDYCESCNVTISSFYLFILNKDKLDEDSGPEPSTPKSYKSTRACAIQLTIESSKDDSTMSRKKIKKDVSTMKFVISKSEPVNQFTWMIFMNFLIFIHDLYIIHNFTFPQL